MIWAGIILVVLAFIVFVNATEKVKYGEFDHISWVLVSFGIYHWGQALVLAAFWMMFGISCIFWWSPNQALNTYILFHVVRALLELFLLADGKYQGLSHSIIPHAKVSTEQRLQLYRLGQGIIILGGIIYSYVT
jgi:hypothetical protein